MRNWRRINRIYIFHITKTSADKANVFIIFCNVISDYQKS